MSDIFGQMAGLGIFGRTVDVIMRHWTDIGHMFSEIDITRVYVKHILADDIEDGGVGAEDTRRKIITPPGNHDPLFGNQLTPMV